MVFGEHTVFDLYFTGVVAPDIELVLGVLEGEYLSGARSSEYFELYFVVGG